jgi:hypothetical protein
MPLLDIGFRRRALLLGLALAWVAGGTRAAQTVEHPFAGVTLISRSEESPRPVKMHVVVIELRTPGIRFLLTPHGGSLDTFKETTLQFLTAQKAQIAVNAHFFEPWPPPSPDPNTADLIGLAASNGQVFSPFDANVPKPYAIRPNAPAINIDANNHASVVHRNPADSNGYTVAEPVRLYNALAGNEQILTSGEITAGTGPWDNTPNPLTVLGLAPGAKLVVLVVDGRQKGESEGLSTREAADLVRRDYGVTDAINLDGGGSATLCLADPKPRVVNVPVGVNNVPGTLRPVGSNLAIFAPAAVTQPGGTSRAAGVAPATTSAPGTTSVPAVDETNREWLPAVACAAGFVALAMVILGLLRRRPREN